MKSKNVKSAVKILLSVFVFVMIAISCEGPDKDLENLNIDHYNAIDKDSIKEEDI